MPGDDGSGRTPGNDRGAGPATPRSPDFLASHSDQHRTGRDQSSPPRRGFPVAAAAVARPAPAIPLPEIDWPEASDGAVRDIEFQCRRQLAGIRHLSRYDRLHASRAIRAWRRAALEAVREKDADARRAARRQRRLLRPAPT